MTRTKLQRILHRERQTQSIFQKDPPKSGHHRYLVMELPANIPERLEKAQTKISGIEKTKKLVQVRPYNPDNPNEPETLAELFNLVLMTSPDPYRPLTEEETRKYFDEGTFIAFLYGKPVGYGVVTIEDTSEGKIGVIAGIGVHPRHRRKKIALVITQAITEWFMKRGDLLKLQCEVYEENKESQAFVSSLGFEVVGEMYLN